MTIAISRHKLIQSLLALGRSLKEELPPRVVQAAIDANPWFTPYYIRRSIDAISTWLEPASLQQLWANYPLPAGNTRKVGIIAAGNVPLVGFHDLLVTILCGHIALVKPSHQDEVLMKWVVQLWKKHLPEIGERIHFFKQLPTPDYLIATGSNNTARYLRADFVQVPHLIRKNRFSVALLHPGLSDEQLHRLSDDIFLYNGLGCRNVSNVLVLPGFDMENWKYILSEYPRTRLNPYYLKKVALERVRLQMLEADFIDTPYVLIKPANAFDFGQMGVLSLQWVESHKQAQHLLTTVASEVQCVVGQDTPVGQAQCPGLLTFADEVNTLEILMRLA
ncbi:MAG: hypothetical protein D6730_13200 [Bacteroidetes bacterium]|nr:MAG: hypothetical protein D6730_13200 [Bacteroidota bacterium]